MRYRVCERCGKNHLQANSPICGTCRHETSKRKCPVEGCETLINDGAKTCLKHRRLQQMTTYTHCRECGIEFEKPLARGVCQPCQRETLVLCACGCGGYRRKYNKGGQVFEYISGHNDNWSTARRPLQACVMCGKNFKAATRRSKLCSLECRAKWTAINPPRERTRILVQCAACGKDIYKARWQTHGKDSFACSKRCQYIIVANKLSGPKSDPKKLALQRDGVKCVLCGFDLIVHVHHIDPKHKGGGDDLENLITLCPNHHAMADRGMIEAREFHEYIRGRVEE